MSNQEGMDTCVACLNAIKKYAEDKGVTICMELLNSKVDHKDYMRPRRMGVEGLRRHKSRENST
jgi:hydroxypyruvate isomerase